MIRIPLFALCVCIYAKSHENIHVLSTPFHLVQAATHEWGVGFHVWLLHMYFCIYYCWSDQHAAVAGVIIPDKVL